MNNELFQSPKFKRNETRQLNYGSVKIGGQNKVVIQSMTTTKTHNINDTLKQIKDLKEIGCELVRVAVFDKYDAESLNEIVKYSPLPIVADIHFNYLFALAAIKAGCSGIRINPGNLANEKELLLIIQNAKEKNTNIRIGINSGSLPKHIIEKYGHGALALFKAMEEFIHFFEKQDFFNIVMSVKSTDPLITLQANQMLANTFNYPIHLGVTEAGTIVDASIKSSIGLGPLLLMGIGDTIRISITGDPLQEISIAKKILHTTKLNKNYVNVISCPTCGRLDFNMEPLVNKTIEYTKNMDFPLTISILGCVVNGIGEGRMADIGIAGSKNKALLFINGKIVKEVNSNDMWDTLKNAIDQAYEKYLKGNN